jgi:hypothetical protein
MDRAARPVRPPKGLRTPGMTTLNARYAAEMSCFVEYWERIHREITGPLPFQVSTGQSAGGVLADVGLEEGPRLEVFHGEWPSVFGGQFT